MTLVNEFLNQYATSTQHVNAQVLREFEDHAGKPVHEAGQDDIISYSTAISHSGRNTQKRKLSTLSAFYKYLMRRGLLNINPVVAVRIPKTDNLKTVRWLDEEERDLLVQRTHDIMHRAVLLAGLSGLRLSEIQGLDVEQYREGRLWNVLGKGDKVRTVPLTNEASEAIEAYIGNRKDGPMFRIGTSRVSRRTLQNIVYEASEKSLGRRISPHVLRHTFCTMAVRAGIPLTYLGRIVGHRNPAITEMYVHLTSDDLEQEVRKLDKTETVPMRPRLVYSRTG